MKRFAKLTIVAIVALWFVGTANAAMIRGEIGMMGYGTTGFDTLTADFVPAPFATMISGVTLDFDTYIDVGDSVAFNSFIFDPWTPPVALWSVGGFTFQLDSVLVTLQTADQLALVGSGVVQGNSFDSTPGNWSMSIDSSDSFFTFSSATAAVPEASILMLLGTGLIGVAFYTRRRK